MPLIPVVKVKKEEEYVFTKFEELALKTMPPEQVKATNHVEHLVEALIDNEVRDASPEHTYNDVFKALRDKNPERILSATKNLTVAERNALAQRIYYHLLSGDAKVSVSTDADYGITLQNARILNIIDSEPIDLFDLCVRLELAGKRNG